MEVFILSAIQKTAAFTPEELVQRLEQNQQVDSSNAQGCLIFKESKRALKDLAKKGELSNELRERVLSVLSQKGFRTYTNDPRVSGTSWEPTKILFSSPRLWQFLSHPEAYPKEAKILDSIHKFALYDLVALPQLDKLNTISLNYLIEMTRAVTLLKLPELESIYKQVLRSRVESNPPRIEIESFYILATLLPIAQARTNPSFHASLPAGISNEELAGEYRLFKEMVDGAFAKEKENLPPEKLFRFFLFLPRSCTSLRLEVLDLLLQLLRTGELDDKYVKELQAVAKGSVELYERLKRDKLVVVLDQIGEMPVILWPLFTESDFIRALMKPGMRQVDRITLEGNKAKVFFLFYDLWIKQKDIKLDSLSVDQLVGLLECAAFFQPRNFDEIRAKIGQAIVKKCDDSVESIARLAEVSSIMDSPELEERVISWLRGNPIFSIQKDGARYAVKVSMEGEPPFATIQSGISVLKALRDNGRLSKIEFQANHDSLLSLLCGVYCCNQLGLLEEKRGLEEMILKVQRWDKNVFLANPIKIWSPLAVIFLLRELDEPVAAHLLEIFSKIKDFSYTKHSYFWTIVCRLAGDEDLSSLKKEVAVFEGILSGDRKLTSLSAKGFPCFLYFLPLEELETRSEEIKLELTRRIKEKQIDFEFLKRAVEDCGLFLPEKIDFINNIRIGIGCNGSLLMIPIDLLVKMKCCAQICSDGRIVGNFENLPIESIQWAIDFIEGVIRKSKVPPMSSDQAKKLTPGQFKALQIMQNEFFNIPYGCDLIASRAAELCSVAASFPEEILPAAAAWAYSIRCKPLFNRCSRVYCGNETLQVSEDENSNEIRLSSLALKPLRMLQAIGKELYSLHIDFEMSPDVVQDPWVKIVGACPNLGHLTLYLKGPVPSLESLHLAQLPKLSWVTINPRGAECWKSLCQLKIPHTLEHLTLFGEINDVKEAAPYAFFRNLPPKNLHLDIDLRSAKKAEPSGFFSSWWSVAESDPVQEIFANLSHCVELGIGSGSCNGFEYVTQNNRQLKKLEVAYQDGYPKIDDLQKLLDRLTDLKTCEFKIGFFHSKSQAEEEEFESYLRSLRELRNCNLKITLGGSYDKKLDRLVNNLPQKDNLPTISFNVHFYR